MACLVSSIATPACDSGNCTRVQLESIKPQPAPEIARLKVKTCVLTTVQKSKLVVLAQSG